MNQSAHGGDKTERMDSLRLSPAQVRELHNGLDRLRRADVERELRDNDRFSYRPAEPVGVEIVHPGGSVMRFAVQPRDLSSSGMGFLHGGFIHPGSTCSVELSDKEDKPILARGTVARCRMIKGRVHEVGIAFDERVELEMFHIEPICAADGDEDVDPDALISTRWSDRSARATLPESVNRMHQALRDVASALGAERVDYAARLCETIRATSEQAGYPTISELSGDLAGRLRGGLTDPRWKQNLLDLAAQCAAARRGLAA